MVKKAKAKAKPKPKKSVSSLVPRIRKLDRKLTRAKAKKDAKTRPPMPNSFRLTQQAFVIFKRFWKPLGGIVLVYLVLNFVFASSLGNLTGTVDTIKANLSGGHTDIAGALGGFASLVGSAGTGASSTGSILQGGLIVLESLVVIWALRQLLANKKIKVKQAYYQSMTPLIPFMLVILFILLQLLPITFGAAILAVVLGTVLTPGSAVTILFGLIFCVLALWSFYMVSGSIFSIYIVTLPEMEPRKALRSSRNLARFRRWTIMRRLVFLPVFVLLLMAILIVPLILFATWLVAPVFYILSMFAILFIHSYLYNFYRSLIE